MTTTEVAIWARALNESEIQDRFKQDSIAYEFLLADATTFNLSNITAARMAINDYSRQYWDEYTVFVENFDSVARIQANNGSINGNFSICEGRFGTGGCFDGESGYIDYGSDSSLKIGNSVSIEAWMKPNDLTNSQFIINNYDADNKWYMIYIYAVTDELTFGVDDGTNQPNAGYALSNFNTGTWYHVAGVRDNGNTLKLYINGKEVVSTSDTAGDITSLNNLYIGRSADSSAFHFNGSIDEVRISNIARRPVSALWTLNYTLASTEAMRSGSRYYWKVRALDSGGEQG